ncbi:putative multiple ankyrin repeats single kh domain protein [Mycena albidolilacea]|uniref:Multiple ankyrin repeats single kh domain protein n=1 Tax=Mycena albidolilacea TaxID=1033008 RepID=A0AAD6ZL12_9AGAR|nr:putative multiple ankyrin repeats single kh domain protein [Mycena albidolilacea]
MLEGLVVVNQKWDFWEGENTRTVTLAHASVEDYFRSEKFAQEYPGYDLRVGPSHRFLAQTCLSYLLQFIDHPLIHKTRTNYPLGPHAAENWYYHLSRSDDPVLLSSLVVHLLQDGSSQYAAFNEFRQYLWSPFQFTKSLSVCSQLGYTEAVRFLLQNGADPNGNDHGFTALLAASFHGHIDIVLILLQSGAKIDTALDQTWIHDGWDVPLDERIGKQLVIAYKDGRLKNYNFPDQLVVTVSKRGQSNIVRLLLKHGANVNAATKEYSALGAASLHGHVNTICFLLEKGAEVNATSDTYGNALQAASHGGNLESVQLLIEHGAEVNAVGGEYGSALQAASIKGNLDICQFLLENGARVNTEGGEYGSALQAASLGGNIEICQLLLEKGAEVNAAGGRYGNALQAASLGGTIETCLLLLENGAEVNATGGRYGSALQAASSRGRRGIVLLLLARGADVTAKGGIYGSPLRAASRKHCFDTVCLLLNYKKGADSDAVGRSSGSAS